MHPPRELTEAEVLRGKLLSPETCDLLRYEVALLTDRLCNIVFPADPVQRETSILEYVEAQAKRDGMISLYDCGMAKVKAGETALEEILRIVTAPEP